MTAATHRRWHLVLPHREYLVRIALHRGLPLAEAEDCAHEAMIRCVEFPTLDERRVVEFLAATTMRLCVDRHRRETRDEKAGVRLRGWYADEPSPEDGVCDRAEAAWVAGLAAALPDSQRSALAAKADGLSGMEVAARHGTSYKAVESLLSRARSQLRAAVASTLSAIAAATAAVNRRGPTPAEAVAGVSLAAFVTVSVLLGTSAPHPTQRDLEIPVAAGAAPVGASRGAVTGPVAAGLPAFGYPVPVPSPPSVPGGGAGGGGLPLPPYSPPPQPLCGRHVPHVDACLPMDDDPVASYTPGQNIERCLQYGVDISHGFECRRSPSPDDPRG